ncbi:uncharacterized protein LOC135939685 [Cloeon dipterum]|uniref:uncharacterized protein LOC135939685 n=1 Tax=Cloeon dipterum TaxID=197152 RepID=UPI0032207EFE
MEDDGDVLAQLNSQNVNQLLRMLENYLPQSIVIQNWIRKHQEWESKVPEMEFKVLSPRAKVSSGCVAICICSGVAAKQYGVVFATEENSDLLKQCLSETKLIHWEEFTHFTGVLECHATIMSAVLGSKGFKNTDAQISQSFLLQIPIERALKQKPKMLPDGFVIGSVDLSHFPEAINIWDGYRRTTMKMFELNISTGVFRVHEDGRKELVAMSVQAEYGGVSILQTAPHFQQQGFGTSVLTDITSKMAKQGIHPHGHVLKDNFQSLGLFKKCGYDIVGKSFWIFIEKND